MTVAADEDVPAFWSALGLPGLADIHVHFLPERMQRRVWEHFAQAGPLIGREWPIRYRWPDDERVRHLDKLGVRYFTALAYAHRPRMAADLSSWTLDFAAATPGCVPSATFYPEPDVLDYVDGALDRGARIFKVHLQVGGFDPTDPLLDPVWGRLSEVGAPAVVHAGSAPVPTAYTGPGPIAALLARHPRLVLIIAHLGSPEYAEFLALADRYPGVHLDTTMAFTDFFEAEAPVPRRLLPKIRDLGLAGRILLGTDFPSIPYPYAHQIESLVRLDLGDEWLRNVCWFSAARLLRLGDFTR